MKCPEHCQLRSRPCVQQQQRIMFKHLYILGFSNPIAANANITATLKSQQQDIPRNESMKAAKKSINTFAKTFLDIQGSDEQSVRPSQLQRGKQLYPPELNSQHNIAGEELLQVAALLMHRNRMLCTQTGQSRVLCRG